MPDASWWDAQYQALAGVDPKALFGAWARRSAQAVEALGGRLDVPYGPTPAETLDVFMPAPGTPVRDVLVFFHGGFWRGSDKALHRFIALAFTAAGTAVVLPNYALCPAVTIGTILDQAGEALRWVEAQAAAWCAPGPVRITVAGHSAGGHLAAMLGVRQAARVFSLSGLHDLRPLMQVPFLHGDLQLTAQTARAWSPALHRPAAGTVVHAVVGGAESAEFQRQTQWLREAWGEAAVPVADVCPGAGHFAVVEALADPAHDVHRACRLLMAGASASALPSNP
ncbi:alpha/beta hydrolase [Pseudacidovorax intermedius]|uniref:alpha/beta hydrolase n=1 Tax=Pseudacidovorax intermedius TaxID=433924 RepID=UPI0026EFF4A2|nr:alpha/beta hydrolase [Pseudacidovorax intermedius]